MLTVVLCPGQMLRAADAVLSSSPASHAATAALEYKETDYSIVNWGVSLTTQVASFTHEPAATGRIIRGVMNFGGGDSNAIPFVWQRDAGKLLLDFNHSRNFTNNSVGVFSTHDAKSSYQTFTGVHLPLNTAAGQCQVLADIEIYSFGSRPNCTLAVRSFWQGRVTLSGRDWQVGLIQNGMNQPGSFENGQLLLRPWEKRNQSFNAYDGSSTVIPFSRKLFVDGHAYQLTPAARPQNDGARLALQFAEQSVALGELKITGKFIQRLVLPGGSYLVVLDQPSGVVKIPTGSYAGQPGVHLEENGIQAFNKSSQWSAGVPISVNDQKIAILNAGGPLTNSVRASRHGQDLRLDYQLVGVGGETYQVANQDRAHAPEFAIFKDNKKIASGKFEFG
jgi:hypothetical protein